MKYYNTGVMLLCLTGLSACSSTRPSPPPEIIWSGCPAVSSCSIPANQAQTQGDLLTVIHQLEQALLTCGLQVETIKQCQQQHYLKAGSVRQGVTDGL
ncbi:Rz1-like lysis system protein LysC [Erwinia sorbitola]|uniref:Rz1-like lysis system protein LysC n=1 Tax=Erwinia sorbitola TaxID=2681984 RepID=UPI001E28E36E|nr:Rz1-like lysis system protein LysC [Erwinia sorbitola]